jgi:hypothetical protein
MSPGSVSDPTRRRADSAEWVNPLTGEVDKVGELDHHGRA